MAWGITVPLLLVIGVAGWLGVRAWIAKGDLEAAQASISTLKAQAMALDIDGATSTLEGVKDRTASAVSLTSDPVWRMAEHIPFAGSNLTAVRELAQVTDDVVVEVAGPLIGIAGALNPASLMPAGAGINVQPLVDALPVISQSNAGVKKAISAASAIDTSETISQVTAAREKVLGLLGSIAPLLDTADEVLPMLPAFLGVDVPRQYVVVFQNNAELRALGGAALSFAIVDVNKGDIAIADVVPAGFERFPHFPTSIVPVPDGVEALYGEGAFGTFIANATVRPDFPTTAEIIQANWQTVFGHRVDGVISIDPVALSYLLRASAPIPLSTGQVLDSTNLVSVLLNDTYMRFNSGDVVQDNRDQDALYQEVVQATFQALTSGALDPGALFSAITQGITERRILASSPIQAEQELFASFGLDGALPTSDAMTERFALYLQDAVGAKINYYLHQTVNVSTAQCRADGLQSYRVTTELHSSVAPEAVSGLNPAILGQWERENVAAGVQRLHVMLYAPPGASFTATSVNGTPVPLPSNHDADRPVGKLTVDVLPASTTTVSYDFVAEPLGQRDFAMALTPIANASTSQTTPLDCSTVAQ